MVTREERERRSQGDENVCKGRAAVNRMDGLTERHKVLLRVLN